MTISKLQKKLVVLAVLLLVLIGAVFKLAGGVLVLSYLKPTYLPPGISIKESRVVATKQTVFTELNFRTVDYVYQVNERVAASKTLAPVRGNYDPLSVRQTCSYFRSPHGQKYRLCHSIDYGKISVFEIAQINGDTFITSNMPTTVGHEIKITDIGKFVDSFKRTPHFFAPTIKRNNA